MLAFAAFFDKNGGTSGECLYAENNTVDPSLRALPFAPFSGTDETARELSGIIK